MIEVTNLMKTFGAVQAVRGVSFTAGDGRITGLLGPNGAGKSTTLRIISTVLQPGGGASTVASIDSFALAEGEAQARTLALPAR